MGATVKTDRHIIDRILNKAVEQIIPSKEALEKELLSGRQLRIYQGFDPTAPSLHIGHAVQMHKLEDFRKLGHKVFFLIGDFTGRIGDPTGKLSTRKKLTEEQVQENLKLYREQASKIIDIDNAENPVEVVYNSHWNGKLTFSEVIELAAHFTVQQMIKRDMYQRRLEEDKPIYLNEFLYPLMQGYDSVFMDIDVELGGNDQLFNMLCGRQLVQEINHKEKFVIAGRLLTTSDGKKMGKSEGNAISFTDSPQDIFGKVMAFTDEKIIPGFELLTDADLSEVAEYEQMMKSGTNPMELKKKLAWRITSEFKSKEDAEKAQEYFESIFQNKKLDAEIEEIEIDRPAENNLLIIDLIVATETAKSKSEARRLIEQGGVSVNNEKVSDVYAKVEELDGLILRVGKKVKKLVVR